MPHRNVPRGVGDHAVLHNVRVRTAVLLDVERIELDDAQAAVPRVRGVAVRVRQRIGDVERKPALPATDQFELQGVELALSQISRHIRKRVHVGKQGQARQVVGVVGIEGRGAGGQIIVEPRHEQLPHRRAEVAHAQAEVAGSSRSRVRLYW